MSLTAPTSNALLTQWGTAGEVWGKSDNVDTSFTDLLLFECHIMNWPSETWRYYPVLSGGWKGCSLLNGMVFSLLPKDSHFSCFTYSPRMLSPQLLLAVLTQTCSKMREDNLSGPGNVSAKWVIWRAGRFWGQVRNACNCRVSLGTPGYPKKNLDFIVFVTPMHLHRTGFSLNLSFWDHYLPISERRV